MPWRKLPRACSLVIRWHWRSLRNWFSFYTFLIWHFWWTLRDDATFEEVLNLDVIDVIVIYTAVIFSDHHDLLAIELVVWLSYGKTPLIGWFEVFIRGWARIHYDRWIYDVLEKFLAQEAPQRLLARLWCLRWRLRLLDHRLAPRIRLLYFLKVLLRCLLNLNRVLWIVRIVNLLLRLVLSDSAHNTQQVLLRVRCLLSFKLLEILCHFVLGVLLKRVVALWLLHWHFLLLNHLQSRLDGCLVW